MTTQTEKQSDVAILEEVKQQFQKPKLFNVIFHNDDYTPMDFVVAVLISIFKKNQEEAVRLTMEVDAQGKAIVGQYSKEIAKTKLMQVKHQADKHNHPLECSMEEAPELGHKSSMKP